MGDSRPNVLFVTDDQHNARCLGCYGNETVQTPNIDGLAEEGVRFDRAYCQNPVCMPSRTSLMTGQYPNSVGVYANYGSLPAEVRSLPHRLSEHGYDTGAFGKIHLPVDWPTRGFDVERSCDFADAEQHAQENDYYAYLERVGYADEYDYGIGCGEYPFKTFVSNIPAEHCVERWTGDETIRWLENRDGDDPFFAWTTFQRPHAPYAPPPEYADRYSPEDVDLPPLDSDEFDSKPAAWLDQHESELYQAASEADIRQVVAHYYSLITMIDEQIGRILDHLEDSGELENTIVVFCSDHGDFAGEHGFVGKTLGISEAVHRVPFIWRYPERFREGAAVDDLVELVDVFPTFCELLDVDAPDALQGRSLAPTLVDGAPVDRDAAYCVGSNARTIRTDNWKLTRYIGDGEGELYDMDTDPWEHENLYHDPDYRGVKLELATRLVDFHAETEQPRIPSGGIPEGTDAHTAWSRRWWKHGGTENETPLSHLPGAGQSLSKRGDHE